uniref:PWWP domain-containing protein n=1 Tax=Serinus canaria TaxID=9135 RepID=A0A8C9N478_SERCA
MSQQASLLNWCLAQADSWGGQWPGVCGHLPWHRGCVQPSGVTGCWYINATSTNHPVSEPLGAPLLVSKCVTEDGRTVSVGDIVWGKIHGFPWWPARVLDINLSQKENGEPSWREAKVSWFGSPTTSFLSVSKLSPFSDFWKNNRQNSSL